MAAVIHNRSKLFASIREAADIQQLKDLFDVGVSQYWDNHYMFGKISKAREKTIGEESVEIILINAVIPVLFIYGRKSGLESTQNKALDFLGQLSPEKNSITDNWKKLGINISSAFQSQALLHLKNSFCDKHLCLECTIGNKILSRLASSK